MYITMNEKIAVVIDNRISRLELIEDAISHVEPQTQCVSFVFGDEALNMINNRMYSTPSHIFIDANLKRTSIGRCLRDLRNNSRLDSCCITVFSDTMPTAVADSYCCMGADFAFSTPLSLASGIELLECILPATRTNNRRTNN